MNAAFHRLVHRQKINPSDYARKFAETQMVYILPSKLLIPLEPTELLEDGNLASEEKGSKPSLSALPFHRSGHRYAFALAVLLSLTGCDPQEPRNADECFQSGGVVWSENNQGIANGCIYAIPADMDSSIIVRMPAETTSSLKIDSTGRVIGGSAR